MKKIGSLLFALAAVAIFSAVASSPASAICPGGPPHCASCNCSTSSCGQECQTGPFCTIKTCGEVGRCVGACLTGGDSESASLNGAPSTDCIDGNGSVLADFGDDWLSGNAGVDGTSGAAETQNGNSGTDTASTASDR